MPINVNYRQVGEENLLITYLESQYLLKLQGKLEITAGSRSHPNSQRPSNTCSRGGTSDAIVDLFADPLLLLENLPDSYAKSATNFTSHSITCVNVV